MEPVFEVVFGCRNCGEEWDDDYPPRHRVDEIEEVGEVTVHNADCEDFGHRECDCPGTLACPNCRLDDTLYVIDRFPVED